MPPHLWLQPFVNATRGAGCLELNARNTSGLPTALLTGTADPPENYAMLAIDCGEGERPYAEAAEALGSENTSHSKLENGK